MHEPVAVSVVIPCYFSEAFVGELVEELQERLDSWCDDYEIILVNDGSTDGTWECIEELHEASPRIRGIDLMRNFGQHNALYVGICASRFDIVVTMDDDLQHPPSAIQTLYHELGDDFDLVYGVPRKEQHGFLRDVASVVAKGGMEMTLGMDFAADTSAFRVFRREAAAAFDSFVGSFVDIDALLGRHTQRVLPVTVEHRPRKYGASNYSFAKLVSHTINMIVLYTTVPLRLISFVGFGFTLFGIGVFAYVVGVYFAYGVAVEGFTFLACTVAMFGGAQLFAIGVLGEYLSRVHQQTMGYPPAIERRRLERAATPQQGRD